MLPEVRMARISDAPTSHRAKRSSCVAAAELPGMSERRFRRLRDAHAAHGAEGPIDRRPDARERRRAPVDAIEWVASEFRSRYFDFTAKHFHEDAHGETMAEGRPLQRSYSWTKSVLQSRGPTPKAKRRGARRRGRERRPLPGMPVFQDGSTHAWLQGEPDLDPIATMDDATSRVLSIFLVEQEGAASSFRGLSETIEAHGLFSSFHTDRGSHCFFTPKAGEKVDKERLTQVGRAPRQLKIEHIPSYGARGRGRMERLWGAPRSRLPPLLRQAVIGDIEAANRWLAEVYLPRHNARFAVAPAEEGSAFVPFLGDLDDVPRIEEERVVSNDNTLRHERLVLRIPQARHRRQFVKARVRVHEYRDGSLALLHGPREIARYVADGALEEEQAKEKPTEKSAA